MIHFYSETVMVQKYANTLNLQIGQYMLFHVSLIVGDAIFYVCRLFHCFCFLLLVNYLSFFKNDLVNALFKLK